MRVLVSGLSGFTGHYLGIALAEHGMEPVSLDVDITDKEAVQDAVAQIHPDMVVHLAAVAFVHSDDYESFYRVNQLGTFNLLDALASHAQGTPVLLASSANIYGSTIGGCIDEDARPNPTNHYAISKWAMEMGAQQWAGSLPLMIVRPFNYTGVGQQERYLIPKIVEHFKRRAPRIELGNLDVNRDFGDVRSVVDAYVRLLHQPFTKSALNVCSGATHTIRQVIDICRGLTGHDIEVAVNPAFVRSNEVALLAGNPGRLQAALPDWKPFRLEETLAWMLEN